jgi:murein tripeptide amidase MpaA
LKLLLDIKKVGGQMKSHLKQIVVITVFLSLLLIPFMIFGTPNLSKGYHNNENLSLTLKRLANINKSISKLISIGRTIKGRDIWLLQITGEKGPTPEEKQALLICGNAEGDHVIGSEVAVNIAQYFITNYGKNKKVTEILDKRTFYIIPRLNPDGAEFFFKKPLMEHPGNQRARDDDYDWQSEEDGPEDLNGDGMITLMRVKNKEGEWYIDSKDKRLMKKKEPGTPVESLYKIYPEGIDNDGDERYNEDGIGGFNINRNFPHNFGYKPKGIGVYPASEKESKALLDFLTRYIADSKSQPRRNICGILLFSKYDNLAAEPGIKCGPPKFPSPPKVEEVIPRMRFRFGRRGSTPATPQIKPKDPQIRETDKKDLYIFKKISDKYKEITGIKKAVSAKPVGSILEWGYFQFGVPTFSANLWSLREEAKKKPQTGTQQRQAVPSNQGRSSEMMSRFRQFTTGGKPGGSQEKLYASNDKKWLAWIDKDNKGKGFVQWQKFQHNQLGEVEIGGFEPYLKINPSIEFINKISKSHAEFALHLAAQFAEIEMDSPQIKKLSSNLFEVKVKIRNRGELPYCTAMGQKSRNISPIILRIAFENDKKMKLFGGSKRYDLQTLDAGAEKEYKWIIISPANKKAVITLWARNGGGRTKKPITLR